MSYVETLERARDVLRSQRRISVRGLGRELGVEGEDLEEIVEELVDIQQVAKRDGKALVWDGGKSETTIAAKAAPTDRGYTAQLAGDRGDAAGYRSGLDEALASAEQVGAAGHAEQIRVEIAGLGAT